MKKLTNKKNGYAQKKRSSHEKQTEAAENIHVAPRCYAGSKNYYN